MPATVILPVFVRVGNTPECRAGEMTLDVGEDVIAAYAAFLRDLADAVEQTAPGEAKPEGGT